MKLVITEKPSVAQSLAKVLGANKRGDGYLEGNGYLVSWCIGHLIELAEPEAYDEKYSKWRYEDLPILPQKWRYEISPSTKKQYNTLKTLMDRDDVTNLICATDAGREGELIFRLVYQQAGCKKPFERLWISSMEDEAIRHGFEQLKPGSEYDTLYEAALCRERADWIVGMNATRLFSCLYHQTLNVGRVMTPTLGMVAMRDAEIMAFVPKPYYTVQIKAGGMMAISRHFDTKDEAERLLIRCRKEENVIVKSIERKEKIEHPPRLYDLTTLQREANNLLGYTAQQTLDYTQELYEKKLVTYPRTDSKYLTDDQTDKLPELVNGVIGKYERENVPIAQPMRVIDSKKVSDHTAIVPTETMVKTDLSNLTTGQSEILKLISVRLMCAVGEDHRYAETSVVVICGGEEFSSKRKEVLYDGWMKIWNWFYPPKEKTDDMTEINIPENGISLNIDDISLKEGKTEAKKHYTEASMLSSMENAGTDEMPGEAERKGIGTPATRAGIIEKLVQKGFIERKGNKKSQYLVATDKGNALITVMPEQIQSPSMTAEWEQKLLQIERGEYEISEFMEEINSMITSLVKTYERVKGAETLMSNNKVIGICPHCGCEVVERQKGWFCSNRECKFALWKDNLYFNHIGKRISPQIAETLLKDGKIYLKDCKSKKTGNTFSADLIMTVDETGKPSFSLEFDNSGNGNKRKYDKSQKGD